MNKPYTDKERAERIARCEVRLGVDNFYTPPVILKPAKSGLKIKHDAECMCHICFNVRLDALVAVGEASLEDLKQAVGHEDEIVVTESLIDQNPYAGLFEEAMVNVNTMPTYKGSR